MRFRYLLALLAIFTLLTGVGSCGTSGEGTPSAPSKSPERSTPPPPLTPGIPVTPPTPVFGDVTFGSHSAVKTQSADGTIVINKAEMTIKQVDFVPNNGKQVQMVEWKGSAVVRPVVDGNKNNDTAAKFSVAAGKYSELPIKMSVTVEGTSRDVKFRFEVSDLGVKIKPKEEIAIQGGKTAFVSVVESWDLSQAKCLQNGQIEPTTGGVAVLTSGATSVANQDCFKECKAIITGAEDIAVDGTDEGTTIEDSEVIDSTSEEFSNGTTSETDKMDIWWNVRLRGFSTSSFKSDGRTAMTAADFKAIRETGVNLVYLDYPCPYGAAAPYGLDEGVNNDLQNAVIWSGEADLYTVIGCRTGPGRSEADFARTADGPVCTSKAAQNKWDEMLREVAKKYGSEPHLLGLDLMVEPHCTDDQWNKLAKEWNDSIRKESTLPIVVESNVWASPVSFNDLMPTGDDRIVYSLHMFEPYEFTFQGIDPKRGALPLEYPGDFYADIFGGTRYWEKGALQEIMTPASGFYKLLDKKKMPASPIFVGQFGSNSAIPSSVAYMKDLISIFEEYGWSWAAYAWESDDNFNYWKKDGKNTEAFKKVFEGEFRKNSYFKP